MFKFNKFVFLRSTCLFSNVHPRKYISLVDVRLCKKHEELKKSPLYLKKDQDFKIGKKFSVEIIEKLFNLRPFVATELVLKYKKLSKVSTNTISNNYELFLKNGIKKETIMQYPEILSEEYVQEKINQLKFLPYDINETAVLICLKFNRLQLFILKELDQHRIPLISKLLDVNVSEVCIFLTKRTFLLSLNLDTLERNVTLLTEFGISTKEIANDLWVLKYSHKLIKERLDLAIKNNVDEIKTWMVRAQPIIFETYVKRRSDNKLILGNNSLAEYLSERLECTVEVAQYLISKQPALKNKSMRKVQEIIDFLYSRGFKPIHVCRVPKILLHSVETTKKRLQELESQGMHIDSLYILTKSKKQYMQFYESLVKTNKNKLKGKINS